MKSPASHHPPTPKIYPLMVLVGINDRWVEMEIDTGARVSLISSNWQEPNTPKLSHIAQKLITYIGENITPRGTSEVSLTYDNQQYHLPFGGCTSIRTYTVRKELVGGNPS